MRRKDGSRKIVRSQQDEERSVDHSGRAYPLGYGNPPEASRFKPGVSGNPKGRPKRLEDGQYRCLVRRSIARFGSSRAISQRRSRLCRPPSAAL